MNQGDPIAVLALYLEEEELTALETGLADPDLDLIRIDSGQEVLAYLARGEVALVLLDASCLQRDGIETTKEIITRSKSTLTPVLIITGRQDLDQLTGEFEALLAAVVDRLNRPIDRDILQAKVSFFVELQKKVLAQRSLAAALEARKIELEQRVAELFAANKSLTGLNLALEKQSQEVTAARDQAQAASQSKSDFVASISHEMRTPMNAIIGLSSLLMKTRLSERQAQYGESIKAASRSLLSLINDVLDLSKIEADKLDLEYAEFDLVHLIESTCYLMVDQAREKEISLVSYVDPRMPALLYGDPDRLRQILLNLLSNAIKFSRKNEVVLRASLDRIEGQLAHVIFSVEDCGIGMSEDEQERLFQPFAQAHSGIRRMYGGTGLGLSICKRLVSMMGGHIGVDSKQGVGSKFWSKLPLEARSLAPVIFCREEFRQVKVLIIHGQSKGRETLFDYAVSCGMLPETAETAAQAMLILSQAAAAGNPFRLVIVDLDLEDVSGGELARRIQQEISLGPIQLILLVAFDSPDLAQQAFVRRCRSSLSKPVRQAQFINCIRRILAGGEADNALNTADSTSQFFREGHPDALILIAEDHPVSQQVMTIFLSDMGFMSHVVANGQEVLDALTQTQYSLILMDCKMPVLDGFEATAAIREDEERSGRHIPIIAMTANAMKDDREKCLAAGLDDYVSKPIDPQELQRILEHWLPPGCRQSESEKERALPSSDSPIGGLYKDSPVAMEILLRQFEAEGTKMLIDLFIEATPETLDRIAEAIVREDFGQIGALAHYLKGSAYTLNARKLSNLCQALEQAAEQTHQPTCLEILQQMKEAFDEVKSFTQTLAL